jgi:hypothetical protein
VPVFLLVNEVADDVTHVIEIVIHMTCHDSFEIRQMSILRIMQNQFPSGVLTLLVLIGTTIVLIVVGSIVCAPSRQATTGGENDLAIVYMIVNVLTAIGCFVAVKWNPKSMRYVLLICNAVSIIAAMGEPSFWKTSLWMLNCGGWVLSIIAGFSERMMGAWSAPAAQSYNGPPLAIFSVSR